jgi:hypothetical protein
MISILRFMMPVLCTTTLVSPIITTLSAQAHQYAPHSINQRQVNQQQRIFKGVKNDKISQKEYRNLEQRALSIQLQERRDRRDGGSFTPQERNRIQQRLDHLSGSIYSDRHD